ncbi:hypothetical protein R1flu_007416 [Riccia fluitans]|uniref:Uncharacterized protein n=1 Tax=Riccia fluitans TaxID=41844 RepID=A0ABD1Z1U2_9MARC
MERERDVGSRTVKNVKGPSSKASSGSSLPVLIDVEDFKGTFSFDEIFKNLVYEVLPPVNDEDITSPNSANQQPPVGNGAYRRSDSDSGGNKLTILTGPPFAEAEFLQPLFRDARKELVDLCNQVYF